MADFKCKLIMQFFSNNILADVAIPNTVTARRTQQLFGNISTDKLKEAQNWAIEKNVASFMLELLMSVSAFIDMWIDFFSTAATTASYTMSFPNADFWQFFI